MVDLELALELAFAEVRRLREQVKEAEKNRRLAESDAQAEHSNATIWAKRYDDVVADTQRLATSRNAIRESMSLLTEALPDIRRRSASRAARIDVHLERLRRLLP